MRTENRVDREIIATLFLVLVFLVVVLGVKMDRLYDELHSYQGMVTVLRSDISDLETDKREYAEMLNANVNELKQIKAMQEAQDAKTSY